MCNKELCEQFVKANGGSRGCLFEGPSSSTSNYDVKYEMGDSKYNLGTNRYSIQNVHY